MVSIKERKDIVLQQEQCKKIINRLRRAEGQLRGIQNMINNNKSCKDIINQLTAVRASIDSAIGIIAAENLIQCLDEMKRESFESSQKVNEAIEIIIRK